MRALPVFVLLLAASAALGASSSSPLAIDPSGNLWTGGSTASIATTSTALQKTAMSSVCGVEHPSPFQGAIPLNCTHGYLQKQDATGNILYATYLSGNSQDDVTAMTTDSQGNVYATGYTYSSDFPVTAGAFQTQFAGPSQPFVFTALGAPFGPAIVEPGGDAFVVKLAPDGTLIYATFLGGSNSEIPTLIAVDATGSVYVSGVTGSSDFPLTAGAISSQHSGYFFARVNPAGTALVYSTYVQPIGAFDVDNSGRAYLTGGNASGNPFVSLLDTNDHMLSTLFTGTTAGAGAAIAITPTRIFLAVSPVPQPYSFSQPIPPQHPLGASSVLQLSLDGSQLLAHTDFVNTVFDSIQLDVNGNAYAFGRSTDKIPTTAIQPLATACGKAPRSFVLEYDSSGSLTTASYFRQGTDTSSAVSAPGHILLYANNAASDFDISKTPAMNFACPRNLASNAEGPGVAPGEIIVIYGTAIGPAQGVSGDVDSMGHLPTSLGGVQVTIGGIAAPLLYAQATEIHAIAPFLLSSTPTIQVQYQGQSAPSLDAGFFSVSPGIFELNGQGAIINQDGTVNSPQNPAPLGSVVSIYATGLGYLSINVPLGSITPIPPPFVTTVNNPQVTFAGVAGTTLWSGSAPTLVYGANQINVQLPSSLPAGTNLAAVSVVMQLFAESSPPVFISVK